MSINCNSMSNVLNLSVENHTIILQNKRELLISDCQGQEVFRCDLKSHQVNMEVRQAGPDIYELFVGSPQLLPIEGATFVRSMNLDEPGSSVVFAKEFRFTDIEYIGTHEFLYECVVAAPPPPFNGFMEYRYRLNEVRLGLKMDGSHLQMIAPCSSSPCTSAGNPGFRELIALKPS